MLAREGALAVVNRDPVSSPAQALDRRKHLLLAARERAQQVAERVLALPTDDEVDVVAVERHRRIQRREVAAPNDRQVRPHRAQRSRHLDGCRDLRPAHHGDADGVEPLRSHGVAGGAHGYAVDVAVDQRRVVAVLERRGDRHDRQREARVAARGHLGVDQQQTAFCAGSGVGSSKIASRARRLHDDFGVAAGVARRIDTVSLT